MSDAPTEAPAVSSKSTEGKKREAEQAEGAADTQPKRARTDDAELGATPRAEDDEIHKLINEREQARSAKDFDKSDAIRSDLRQRGVDVYDKDKIWVAADGRRGAIIVGEGAGASCALSNAEIAQKVQQREQVRASKDFGAADTMRDELRACGVDIYDKEKIWKSNDGRQGRVGYGVNIQESVGVVGGAPDDAEIDTGG